MKFCSDCGSANLVRKIPEGDQRLRVVCGDCKQIFYSNPKIVAGAVLVWQQRILLAKRSIQPRRGLWTLPAGFMENGETMANAAARECHEEALARPASLELYGLFDLPHINQVYVMYHGELHQGQFGVGEESLETRLYSEAEIPWKELAFPIVIKTLKRYFNDRLNNHFPVFQETMSPRHDPVKKP